MRRAGPNQHYLALAVVLITMLTLSKGTADSIRCGIITTLAPITGSVNLMFKGVHFVAARTAEAMSSKVRENRKEALERLRRLERENEYLRGEVAHLIELLRGQRELSELQGGVLQTVGSANVSDVTKQLQMELTATPARVVFRGNSTWTSSLWIDVGQVTNRNLGRTVVADRSPVVCGNALVGVVEHVGKYRSRVRLLTDTNFQPAVRALRGLNQNGVVVNRIDALSETLLHREDLAEYRSLLKGLQLLKKKLSSDSHSYFLAKGELSGLKGGLWRSGRGSLRGTGFNYDFRDERGPARDLRTGEATDPSDSNDCVPILKSGDLLVTSGMDGVFPEGLFVAEVTRIDALREGGFYYDLEARPVIDDLDHLSLVFVLPPPQPAE